MTISTILVDPPKIFIFKPNSLENSIRPPATLDKTAKRSRWKSWNKRSDFVALSLENPSTFHLQIGGFLHPSDFLVDPGEVGILLVEIYSALKFDASTL